MPLTPAAQYLIQLSNQTTGVTMVTRGTNGPMIKALGICRAPVSPPLNTVDPSALLGAPAGPSGPFLHLCQRGRLWEQKKARREKLPFMRRINSIFTPRDLSFSFGSPSQERHASNLVAQYRERQAAGDKDAGPPSSTGGKSRGCIRFFPLLPFHPPRDLAGLPQ